jgi:4-hydroxymandelate oxidase
MAPADDASTPPGPCRGGAPGVSRVLAGLGAEWAHTMALCGLPQVRNVPRKTVPQIWAPVTSAT